MKNRPFLCFILIYTIFLCFILLTFKSYGISWDETSYLQQGQLYSQVFFDPSKTIDTTTNEMAGNHAIFLDMLYFLPLKLFGQAGNYETLHLEKAIIASFTLLFMYLSLRAISKDNLAPLFAILFLIFSPRWLGDIFDNELDISAALLYSIELFFAIKILTRYKTQGVWKWILMFSIVSGLSFSQRVALVFIPATTLLLMILTVVIARSNEQQQSRLTRRGNLPIRLFCLFILFGLVFAASLFFTDPLVSNNGLLGIISKITVSLHHQGGAVLYDGKMFSPSHLPMLYLPKYIGITTPIITLLFLALGTIAMLLTLSFPRTRESRLLMYIDYHFHGNDSEADERVVYFLILASFFLPIFFVVLINPQNYDAWRHFLFLAVPLSAIAGIGIGILFKKSNTMVKGILIAVFLFNLVITQKELIRLHPYEYVYFNELVQGLPGAYGKYETDYWAKSTKEAVIWLTSTRMPAETYTVYNCTDPVQASYYFTPNIVSVDNPNDADYAICFTRYNLDKHIKGKTIYTVRREGVPLMFVKSTKP